MNSSAQLYDTVARVYDGIYTDPANVAEDRRLASILTGAPRPVLDVGCGTGLGIQLLGCESVPADYGGIDISGGMLEVAREKYPAFWFARAPAEELPARAESYGTVMFLYGVLNHADVDKSIAEARRVLKCGGWLVAVVAHGRDGYVPACVAKAGTVPDLGDLYQPRTLAEIERGLGDGPWSELEVQLMTHYWVLRAVKGG